MRSQNNSSIRYDIHINAKEIKINDDSQFLTLRIPTKVFQTHINNQRVQFTLDIENLEQITMLQKLYYDYIANMIPKEKQKNIEESNFLASQKNSEKLNQNCSINNSSEKPQGASDPFKMNNNSNNISRQNNRPSYESTKPDPFKSNNNNSNGYQQNVSNQTQMFSGNFSLGNQNSKNTLIAPSYNQNNSLFGPQNSLQSARISTSTRKRSNQRTIS